MRLLALALLFLVLLHVGRLLLLLAACCQWLVDMSLLSVEEIVDFVGGHCEDFE